MITKLKQWYKSFMFVLSFLRDNSIAFGLGTSPVIYMVDGVEQSKELFNEIVEKVHVNLRYTDIESEANVILTTKTSSIGFMFTDKKLNLFVPLRNESNGEIVDLSIGIIARLLDMVGRK